MLLWPLQVYICFTSREIGESGLRTSPRCNLPLRSSAATLHVVGPVAGVVSSKFLVALRSESLYFLASSAAWPSVGSARAGAVCRAAPVEALLGLLAECPRLSPAWIMLVAPVASTLGGAASHASPHRIQRWLTGRPISRAGRQQPRFMRRAGCRQRRQSVPTGL